jgi:hypothetical protein
MPSATIEECNMIGRVEILLVAAGVASLMGCGHSASPPALHPGNGVRTSMTLVACDELGWQMWQRDREIRLAAVRSSQHISRRVLKSHVIEEEYEP